MTKKLALAVSILTLIAVSGQASADTPLKNSRYGSEATAPSDRQAINAFYAFDPAIATQATDPDEYRYHGGPKSNE